MNSGFCAFPSPCTVGEERKQEKNQSKAASWDCKEDGCTPLRLFGVVHSTFLCKYSKQQASTHKFISALLEPLSSDSKETKEIQICKGRKTGDSSKSRSLTVRPGWPQTLHSPASASQVLTLEACATLPGS